MRFNNIAEPTPEIRAQLDASGEKIAGAMDALENLLVKSGTGYVVGNSPTIADFQLFCEANDHYIYNMNFQNHPKTAVWF